MIGPGQHSRGSRSRARERALQALYQVDLAKAEPLDALSNAWKSEDVPADAEAHKFAEELVKGVVAHLAEIDQRIEATSHHWRVERMAKVDRNVLRLAVFELTKMPATPRKVVLNEAVELAKMFGSEESGAFVNGILDKIAASMPKESP
ncbi:MAG TPA: transcription antitermination factor NusB [Myxococcales bacterium]|jgi:N utilization substance protein B